MTKCCCDVMCQRQPQQSHLPIRHPPTPTSSLGPWPLAPATQQPMRLAARMRPASLDALLLLLLLLLAMCSAGTAAAVMQSNVPLAQRIDNFLQWLSDKGVSHAACPHSPSRACLRLPAAAADSQHVSTALRCWLCAGPAGRRVRRFRRRQGRTGTQGHGGPRAVQFDTDAHTAGRASQRRDLRTKRTLVPRRLMSHFVALSLFSVQERRVRVAAAVGAILRRARLP